MKSSTNCYGTLEKFFFTVPTIFLLIGARILYWAFNGLELPGNRDPAETILSILLVSLVLLPCPITVLVKVKKRAKRHGEKHVMVKFLYDCVKFFLSIIFFFILAFIKFAEHMDFMQTNWIKCRNRSGDVVLVKYLGDNVYETSDGERYEEHMYNCEPVLIGKGHNILRYIR